MEILAQLIDSLAWPIIVLIIILIFRSEFLKALTKLSNLKYKDFEAKFGNQLSNVEKKVQELDIHVSDEVKVFDKVDIKEETNFDRLFRISEISPRASIT